MLLLCCYVTMFLFVNYYFCCFLINFLRNYILLGFSIKLIFKFFLHYSNTTNTTATTTTPTTMSSINYYKQRLYDEIFKNIICLQFSDKFIIPLEIQSHIISFLPISEIIHLLLKERQTITYHGKNITIGKINHFWYTDYKPKPSPLQCIQYTQYRQYRPYRHQYNKWEIFKTCSKCHYCKPIHHNYIISPDEYSDGFYVPETFHNNHSFICLNCK